MLLLKLPLHKAKLSQIHGKVKAKPAESLSFSVKEFHKSWSQVSQGLPLCVRT